MPFKVARRTDQTTAEHLGRTSGVLILVRRDGIPLALFESEYWLQRIEADHPEWCLDRILSGPRSA